MDTNLDLTTDHSYNSPRLHFLFCVMEVLMKIVTGWYRRASHVVGA